VCRVDDICSRQELLLLMLKFFGILQKVSMLLQIYNCIQDFYHCGGISTFDMDYILVCDEANTMVVINLVLGICEYNVLFCHDFLYCQEQSSFTMCVESDLVGFKDGQRLICTLVVHF
jgi:hypothetical protein